MPRATKQQIKAHLIQSDRKLEPIIASLEYPPVRSSKDVYATLLHSIIFQQLSITAADTIHRRFLELFPQGYADPARLKRMSLARLRSAGVSKQKAGYLQEIATFAMQQGLDHAQLARKSDAEIIEHLTQIRGVGKWTVEMLLMFTMNRLDVFPLADIGIQNAMRKLYRLRLEGKAFEQKITLLAEHWKPYRTIACRYLWGWKSNGYYVL